jgi:hypothetical protein
VKAKGAQCAFDPAVDLGKLRQCRDEIGAGSGSALAYGRLATLA